MKHGVGLLLPECPLRIGHTKKVAAAGVDTPDVIFGANLRGWYKADTGVYNDAGSTLATDGQTVQQWNDQSGIGNNISQATGGNRPTYDTTGFNGTHGVVFDSASLTRLFVSFDTFDLGGSGALSVFVVGQMLTGTDSNGRLVAYVGNGLVNSFDNDSSSLTIIRNGTADEILFFRNGTSRNAAVSLATNYRLGVVCDKTNTTIYVNNSAGTPVADARSYTSPGGLFIGEYEGAGWDGAVAEIVVLNVAPNGTQLNSLDAYFVDKWGL